MENYYVQLKDGDPTPIADTKPPAGTEEVKRAAEAKRATADAKVQLNAVRDSFSGPYKVKGESVQAIPQFRRNMANSKNAETAKRHWNELVAICTKAKVSLDAITNAYKGQPTPEELVQVTQALIDAGKLPPPTYANTVVEKRIRQMQYDWGIGINGTAYVGAAAVAVHGNGAQSLIDGKDPSDDIYSILQTPAFKKVAGPKDICTGDIIHLETPGSDDYAIVYSHEIATNWALDKLSVSYVGNPDALRSFLSRKGPIHVLTVDSSLNHTVGENESGLCRETWLYDESSGEWGSIVPRNPISSPDAPKFVARKDGPYHQHIFKGAFRPSDAKIRYYPQFDEGPRGLLAV